MFKTTIKYDTTIFYLLRKYLVNMRTHKSILSGYVGLSTRFNYAVAACDQRLLTVFLAQCTEPKMLRQETKFSFCKNYFIRCVLSVVSLIMKKIAKIHVRFGHGSENFFFFFKH